MTLGLILEVLGLRKGQGVFNHENCPFQEISYPHMAHAREGRDVPYVVNYIFDVVYFSGLLLAEVSKNQLSSVKDLSKLRKRHFTIKRLVVKEHKKTRKLVGLGEPSKNPDIGKAITAILDEVKAVRRQTENNDDKMTEIQKELGRLTFKEVGNIIKEATRTQNKLLATEFIDLKKEVKELLEEVKIDPDNPKPTEIRTEENSKQILELSRKVIPLVEKVSKTLTEANAVLKVVGGPATT